MSAETLHFTALLRVWQSEKHGGMGWVQIEGEEADKVRGHELMRRLELGRRRGFGSVKVNVRLGECRWATSAFPQKEGGWFLPIKKQVIRTEDLEEGDTVAIELELL